MTEVVNVTSFNSFSCEQLINNVNSANVGSITRAAPVGNGRPNNIQLAVKAIQWPRSPYESSALRGVQ